MMSVYWKEDFPREYCDIPRTMWMYSLRQQNLLHAQEILLAAFVRAACSFFDRNKLILSIDPRKVDWILVAAEAIRSACFTTSSCFAKANSFSALITEEMKWYKSR